MEDLESDDGYIKGRDESQHGRPLTPYYSVEDLEFLAKCDCAIAQLNKIKARELAKQQRLDYDYDPYVCNIAQCFICYRMRMTTDD